MRINKNTDSSKVVLQENHELGNTTVSNTHHLHLVLGGRKKKKSHAKLATTNFPKYIKLST